MISFLTLYRLVHKKTLRGLAAEVASAATSLLRIEKDPERLGPRLGKKLAAHLHVPRAVLSKRLDGERLLAAIVKATATKSA